MNDGWDDISATDDMKEDLNPSISCGFSRNENPQLEQHAPTPLTDPS